MWKILIVFLLVFVNFGYWYWTTTPFYSILEIRESIVHHDLKTFEQYVDVERVSSNMIDGFLTPQVRSRLSKGVLGDLLGSSLISLVKPTLMDVIKNEVSHFVESNQLAVNQGAGRITRGRKRAENATAPAIGRVLKVTRTKDGKLVYSEVSAADVPANARTATAVPAGTGQSGAPAVIDAAQRGAAESASGNSGNSYKEKTSYSSVSKPVDTDEVQDSDTTSNQDEDSASSKERRHARGLGGFGLGDLSMKNVTGKLGFGARAFKKIAFIRVRKNDATIGVTLFNKRYDTNMLLELRMEKQKDHWRLVEVSNFASFVYLIIAYEQARRDKTG